MGKHKLFCVLGEYVQYYNDVHIDGLCDYAFFTFYDKTGASFTFFPGPAMNSWIRKSQLSKRHKLWRPCPPKGKKADIALRTIRGDGENVIRNFWSTYKIYNYGVLNLEVKPWEAPKMSRRIRKVFEFLKELRHLQAMLKIAFPQPHSPPRGFIVLGIRLWPANMVSFLTEIDNAFHRWFIPDGVIPLTHINENEIDAGYKNCWISGGAPYRLAPEQQQHQCARACSATPCAHIQIQPSTRLQNVVVGRTSANNMLSTFESQITINSKVTQERLAYMRLRYIAVVVRSVTSTRCTGTWTSAWPYTTSSAKTGGLVCPRPTAGIYATNRFGKVSQHTHKLANDGVASACT
ncbi:hypothetical protein MRX96_003374 [Rhipicephalus microplus]